MTQDPPRNRWARQAINGGNPEVAKFYSAADTLRIPGSAIKGVLSNFLGKQAPLKGAVFGELTDGKLGLGGKVIFRDALRVSIPVVKNHDRYWLPDRGTYVQPSVSISPHLRSAEEHLLFYTEFAPAGTVFDVTLIADSLSVDELSFLRATLLDGFNTSGSRLGAGTANGWGKLLWKEIAVESIDKPALDAWIQNPACHYEKLFKPVNVAPLADAVPTRKGATLDFDVTLRFTGRMLVNDPTQERPKSEQDHDGSKVVGKAPVLRADGSAYLPAESVRGALRSQARRIWQTVHYDSQNLSTIEQKERRRLNPRNLPEVKRLPGFHRLFGAGGWKSPIEVSDFTPVKEPVELTQHFVAIDRFHGGAAAKRKFQALALDRPHFRGKIRLDVDALKRSGCDEWAYLFLLFVFRDLKEGDITFGSQSAKGYGACEADVRVTGSDSDFAGVMQRALDRDATVWADRHFSRWNMSWTELTKEADNARAV